MSGTRSQITDIAASESDPPTAAPVTCDDRRVGGVYPSVASSDVDLVVRARGGDLDAFTLLVARYRDRFVRYAKHLLGSHEDAEEAVQDAFVRAHRALSQCDPERFAAWAYRILINRCRTMSKRRRWWKIRADDIDRAVDVGVPHPAAQAAWREEIERALRGLSEEQREAFLLKYVEDMSYQEISLATGASIPALKMRVSRACERMRGMLGGAA